MNTTSPENLFGLDTSILGIGEPDYSGKVRQTFWKEDEGLMIAGDTLSAFDVRLEPVPGKGIILTQMSLFWFEMFKNLVPNHVITTNVDEIIERFGIKDTPEVRNLLDGRSMIVKRLNMFDVELVARGYLTGSGKKDYEQTGMICGVKLQEGLVEASQIEPAILTPASKVHKGHDINVSFGEMIDIIGDANVASDLRKLTLDLYNAGRVYADSRGIIIADTKFEFGRDSEGRIVLADEVLTPDSSRFWPKDKYQVGRAQESLDKQPVRDYLEEICRGGGWGKTFPGPKLPRKIKQNTLDRYLRAYMLITGIDLRNQFPGRFEV